MLKTIVGSTLKSVVTDFNDRGYDPSKIISIMKEDGNWYLVYYY